MERFPHPLDRSTVRPATAAAARKRHGHLLAVPHGADAEFPSDLAEVPTRRLRMLCDSAYQLLDTRSPFLETRERYDVLVEELERRERQAERRGGSDDAREKFRDNALFSRFELYRNGVLAGYVQYDMRGGDVVLLHAVVEPRFRHLGLEQVLMQAVLLNAHRRRLAVVPYCPEAQDFLVAHPQFLPLVPAQQRRRFRSLLAARAGR